MIFRLLSLCLAVAVCGAALAQERPRAGLMWNRTGLPLVFPLILKTVPGEDFYVVLRNAETEEAAMAAYARGGQFFRVLVPPGTYDLYFAAGNGWQGEEALFGPGDSTRRFRLDQSLTFEVRGVGTKAGHIVDLTGEAPGVLADAGPTVSDYTVCQVARPRLPEPRIGGDPDPEDWEDRPLRERYALGYDVYSVVCG